MEILGETAVLTENEEKVECETDLCMENELANARKRSGLTQKQMAEKFGVTEKTIHNWETGKPIPASKMPSVEKFINNPLQDSPVRQRLIQFIKHKGLEQQKFEMMCGLSSDYVDNIARGLGAQKLSVISKCFPELNTEWLLTGAGEMLNYDIDGPNYMIVETRPRVPFKAIDGNLRDYYLGDKRNECEQKPIVKQFPQYNFTMLISRNVMSPYIDTGDVIACAEIPKITTYGHVYVMDTEGEVLIRRVYLEDGEPNKPNKYKLVAENKGYPDLIIDSKDVKGIYRIVGMLRVEI